MRNVLAIGAHPDDIELGCVGTLLKHKENGDRIILLVLTKGEASGSSLIREQECVEASKMIGADKLIFGGLQDTKVSDGFETIEVIEKVINTFKPSIIYTHSYQDTHQDHRNASYASLSAGRRSKKILMYESPTTYQQFVPHVFINIDTQFERKKEIIRIYNSQSDKTWWSVGKRASLALEGLASYRGFQAGLAVAEAFELVRLVIDDNEPILKAIENELN
jgi:LmbE family N-acetylglucosaminyl deacetylase